jgi:hypothetical protein
MVSDKNALLVEMKVSTERNLLLVGGCTDTPVDLVEGDNSDGKRPCRENTDAKAVSTDGRATIYANGQAHMFERKKL